MLLRRLPPKEKQLRRKLRKSCKLRWLPMRKPPDWKQKV